MELPDVKIHRSAEYLQDKIRDDIDFVFIVLALFLISGSIYFLTKAVTKGSVRVERFDRTAEENTDALVETTREIKALRRALQGKKHADYE